MTLRPVELSLPQTGTLQITWNDGNVRHYSFQELREHCPCASCREIRRNPPESSLLPILSEGETTPLKIESMDPVGNYAYSIGFSDGHDTGIYQITLLLELGRPVS